MDLSTTLAADENVHFPSRKEGQLDVVVDRIKHQAKGGAVVALFWLFHISFPLFRPLTFARHIPIFLL